MQRWDEIWQSQDCLQRCCVAVEYVADQHELEEYTYHRRTGSKDTRRTSIYDVLIRHQDCISVIELTAFGSCVRHSTMFAYRSKSLTWQTAFAPKQLNLNHRHPQAQSALFNQLPAKLRNKIYSYVFAHEDSSVPPPRSPRSLPHPLSLLLTCRQTYHEASILAFSTYTFPVKYGVLPTYLDLKAMTSHLSTLQVEAIGSLSALSSSHTGSLLSNALLIFPHLNRFVIKIEAKSEKDCKTQYTIHWPGSQHHATPSGNQLQEPDLCRQAIEKYAPYWLQHGVIQTVTEGRAYAWQDGSRWTAQWPQLESEQCYSKIQCDKNGLREELYMDADAVGEVPGVQLCACGCKNVSWTAVVLVQEGGRRVNVEILCCEVEISEPVSKGMPSVVLVPGAAPLSEASVSKSCIGYEADEKYWEALRRKNGNLGALYRGLWKT